MKRRKCETSPGREFDHVLKTPNIYILEVLVVKTKKIIRALVASLLVLVCAAAMFGCDGGIKPQHGDDGKLPQQHINQRYYFQQGYRTDWDILEVNSEKFMVDKDTGLVMVLAPVQTTTNANGEEVPVEEEVTLDSGEVVKVHKAVEGVEYCIYYYNGEGIYMTTSRADIVRWLQDPENTNFYFNNKHFRGSPRDTFLLKGEADLFTAKYSKLQFTSQAYTFTKDGEDWQGVYNVVMSGLEYFIVTYEAKADIYDKYYSSYYETIGDFRKKGWETSDVG